MKADSVKNLMLVSIERHVANVHTTLRIPAFYLLVIWSCNYKKLIALITNDENDGNDEKLRNLWRVLFARPLVCIEMCIRVGVFLDWVKIESGHFWSKNA